MTAYGSQDLIIINCSQEYEWTGVEESGIVSAGKPSKHADVGMRSAASRVGVDTAASAIDRYDNVGLMMGESWHLIGSMPGERRHVNVGNW